MNTLICPSCSNLIHTPNINVQTDVYLCTSCGMIGKISAILGTTSTAGPVPDVSSTPPVGSRIVVESSVNRESILTLPRLGFKPAQIPMMFFASFWMVFILVWTVFASMGSPLFALFSIPFWIVGGGMWFGIINQIKEVQTLTVSRSGVQLNIQRPFKGEAHSWTWKEIDDVKIAVLNSSFKQLYRAKAQFGRTYTMPPAPTIVVGVKHIHFFESVSEPEQNWVVSWLLQKQQSFQS